jgi:hypothetical protein
MMNTERVSTTSLPPGVPAEAVPYLQEVGYLEPDGLAVGEPAPDAPVFTPEGDMVPLRHCWDERPAVLIFASYT